MDCAAVPFTPEFLVLPSALSLYRKGLAETQLLQNVQQCFLLGANSPFFSSPFPFWLAHEISSVMNRMMSSRALFDAGESHNELSYDGIRAFASFCYATVLLFAISE